MTTILLAIAIGAAFGFILDRIGATNPTIIGNMLALKNLYLMKTILFAIGFASLLMFGGQMLGLVDVGHMSVKAAYAGVFAGGLILGLGWALSGYCPGTGLAAAATGRVDALLFILGGLSGAFAFMLSYDWGKSTGLLSNVLGGKTTLGAIPGADYQALFPAMRGDVIGIVMGLAFIAIAFTLPLKPASKG
ncbi:MAG: hypothetical protein DHS20C08_16510 [Rhodomicrobium sp.]|nr:MAG: hypothetical protein DHS20C08_16510 [Rhodomicrobium sp.]